MNLRGRYFLWKIKYNFLNLDIPADLLTLNKFKPVIFIIDFNLTILLFNIFLINQLNYPHFYTNKRYLLVILKFPLLHPLYYKS